MRLETKLGLQTGIMLSAVLIVALGAKVYVLQAGDRAHRVAAERTAGTMKSREVRLQLLETVLALEAEQIARANGSAPTAAFHTEREEHWRIVQNAWAELTTGTQHGGVPGDPALLAVLDQDISHLRDCIHRYDAVTDAAAGGLLIDDEVSPLRELMRLRLNAFIDSQVAQSASESAAFEAATAHAMMLVWIAALLVALLGALLSLLLGRRVATALDRVAERADAIANGDLTGTALSGVSVTQIIRLGQAMDRMQRHLRGIIGTVAGASNALSANAESMQSASEQMHHRIDLQSQQTQQAAAAMTEMSISIAEVSRHTQNAAENARDAARAAQEGGDIVKEVLVSMQGIANVVTETSETVTLLGDDSRRISQIITVIDDIAKKTNLLALNAAIEAARAGEQGRGFAVVAGEVRRLAESTAKATGEIAGMIQGVQQRTRTAVASMHSGDDAVSAGIATTTQAGEVLQRIIGMAERVDRMIAQIAIATSQQAAAANQSSTSLDAIHQLSNDNVAEMSTTARGIEDLRTSALAMEEQVDRFVVDERPPSRQSATSPRAAHHFVTA